MSSDIHALSGAYAVDALDDIERARFELHLAECTDCQAEVASLSEAAATMSELATVEPSPELRNRVLAGISTVRPLPPVVAEPAPTEEMRPRRRFRLAVVAAAAAVVTALGVGGAIVQPWADDTSQAPSAAELVLSASDAKSTSLDFDGGASAKVTHSDSVGKAVIQTKKMPPPPDGMVYQLWLDQPDSGMTSAGVMPVRPDQTVVLEGDAATAKAAGITVEPEGGSTHPTSDPIALFDFGGECMIASPTRRVAVIGSGVAGLTAAYVASRSAHVTLIEADERLGGHADTHVVQEPARTLAIDTGFIVHNERTYPTLVRLFRELGVATQESEMSLSVRDDETGLEYAGALGARGLFPGARNLGRPAYLRMLLEIPRFHRRARALLDTTGDDVTLREFLCDGGFSPYFTRHFVEPLVAAVWSTDPDLALDYPARYLFTFLDQHGMLGVFGSPPWRTVAGGSREYVARVAACLAAVRTGTKVTSVLETGSGVEVTDGNGAVTTYDAVVIATHPAQALTMLAEPTGTQRAVLGALPYSRNVALLHTDTTLLPDATTARASWNFRRPLESTGHVTVTYDLTRLQRLPTDTRYLVTLGGEQLVDPAAVIDRMEYEHPLFTPESVAAQARLPEIDTDRVSFAGAYHGWGFHEDGARSGLAAAERLGFTGGFPRSAGETRATRRADSACRGGFPGQPGKPAAPAIYETTIRHTRRTPFKRSFTHRSHTWLVDLDELPDHGPLARFEARDHLGDPERSIRDNLAAFLADRGVELGRGRVLMAANARAFGYCFNPITVFWCSSESGDPLCTVVEVHNTYGDRHAYLVRPDEQGRASTPKEMYVSPFHGTDGTYELAVPRPTDELHVAVTLRTDDGARFSASLAGRRSTRGAWRAAPAALGGSLLIRAHGIWLWARRLPIQSRPDHHQEGVR